MGFEMILESKSGVGTGKLIFLRRRYEKGALKLPECMNSQLSVVMENDSSSQFFILKLLLEEKTWSNKKKKLCN